MQNLLKGDYMIEFFIKSFALSHFISISLTQVIFAFLTILLIYNIIKKRIYLEWNIIILLFILYFIWIDISHVVNIDRFNNLTKFFRHLFGWWHYLIFYVTYLVVKNTESKFRSILSYVLIGSTFASLYGVYQFIVLNQRAEGFYSHSLTFGNNLSLILIILYVLLITKTITNKREFFIYMLAIIINLTGLFVSLSRGPFLALLISIFILNIIAFKYKGSVFNIIIVVIFSIIIFSSQPLKQRAYDFFNDSWKISTSSFGTRVVLWKTSIDIIKDNPIFGIGYDIKNEFKKRIKVPVSSMAHSHNSYLTVAVYHGVPALIILLLIFCYLFKFFWLNDNLLVKMSGIGILLVYLLEGLTENNFGDAEVTMLFWFLTGILYALHTKSTNKVCL
ncbi:O-antigen ligase family protein [Deferribacter abyssi]|uniref:O-antigen ligase family protein n=1 Tax=Deferribacter abyssi TaxID=213806 RepID=UPI003C1E7D83